MNLSDLTIVELDIVADELDKTQFAIKVNINTNYREMSESKIR